METLITHSEYIGSVYLLLRGELEFWASDCGELFIVSFSLQQSSSS